MTAPAAPAESAAAASPSSTTWNHHNAPQQMFNTVDAHDHAALTMIDSAQEEKQQAEQIKKETVPISSSTTATDDDNTFARNTASRERNSTLASALASLHAAATQQQAQASLSRRSFESTTSHSSKGSAAAAATTAGLQLNTELVDSHGSLHLDGVLSSSAGDDSAAPATSSNPVTIFPGFESSRPYLRSNLSLASLGSSVSPTSVLSSPALAAFPEITPLPSPLLTGEPLALWKRTLAGSRPASEASYTPSIMSLDDEPSRPSRSPAGSIRKKKYYGNLTPTTPENYISNASPVISNGTPYVSTQSKLPAQQPHISQQEQRQQQQQQQQSNDTPMDGRNRSISEFVPEVLHNGRGPRNVAVSSSLPSTNAPEFLPDTTNCDTQLHREEYLARQRGLSTTSAGTPCPSNTIPSPPASNRSMTGSDENERERIDSIREIESRNYLEVRYGRQHRKKYFRTIRQLGQGTFSRVMLCTSELKMLKSASPAEDESKLNPRKLVAIKIVQHGPAGGADEERIEVSLKREIDILKSLRHPSLVRLKAFDGNEKRALLVLTYCPGGDLFDLASQHRAVLTPGMIQRIFAELIAAVRYLHAHLIVHRDIKLENILVNLSLAQLTTLTTIATTAPNPQTYPTPLITLTDMGLSRRITTGTLLTTRCGSEDYAAPELLLGQSYDGRATDAWALGVVLYALIEGRLPFDPPPNQPHARARPSHRIARCDWVWCAFGDADGDWNPRIPRAEFFEGGREVVEALLRKARTRKTLEEVAKMSWVEEGIQVPGGLGGDVDEDGMQWDGDVVMEVGGA